MTATAKTWLEKNTHPIQLRIAETAQRITRSHLDYARAELAPEEGPRDGYLSAEFVESVTRSIAANLAMVLHQELFEMAELGELTSMPDVPIPYDVVKPKASHGHCPDCGDALVYHRGRGMNDGPGADPIVICYECGYWENA